MANSPSGQSVVHRVSRILQCFDAEHPELSAGELAAKAGLSSSTAHRLAVDMAREGLLVRVGRGRFRVGLRLWEAGQRGSAFRDIAQAALPFMEAVHITLRQNVSLSILDAEALEVVYLARLAHRGAKGDLTQVAVRQPVLTNSAGLIILAHSPPALQRRVIEDPPPAARDADFTPDRLRRMLAEARTSGYVHLTTGLVPTLTGLAAPVLDAKGGALAAMAVVQTREEVNLPVQVPVLKSAAHGLSRALGERPEGALSGILL